MPVSEIENDTDRMSGLYESSLAMIYAENRSEMPEPVTIAGNELTLFAETPELLYSLLTDIERAQERIWIEAYIFVDDRGGKAVAEALKHKAAQGLDVRVLYDAFGSQATSSAFFEDMRAGGVQVHAYRSVWDVLSRHSLLRFFKLMNRRDHRKIMVIDNEIGYFGGMNIVDQTDPGTMAGKSLPTSAGWRDVHVRLSGPQQVLLSESFERSWRRALHQKQRPKRTWTPNGDFPGGDDCIRFFDCGPNTKRSRAATAFRKLIRAAQREIILSMAYFIPTGRVLRELFRAQRRGVKVVTIVPGDSDVKLVQWATRHLYATLLAHGIELYERCDRMLHSKVMIVDGQWTLVGSCNLDPRSLWINHEFLAIVRSDTFARRVRAICDHEIEHSKRIGFEDCHRRAWWQRVADRMAYSIRSFL